MSSATVTRIPRKAVATVGVEVRKVTPKQAREWLEVNEVNRKLRPKLVAAYRRDMEEGRWVFTGEPIQLSRTGRLLNGQHRLSALAGSKLKGLDLVVATGLPDDAQAMMDQGISRNVRDALMIEHGHIKNIAIVASVCRWMTLFPEVGPDMNWQQMRSKVTAAASLQTYNTYGEEIDVAAERSNSLRPIIPGSPSAVAYTWLQLHRVDPEKCTEFFAGMADMEWSYANDPRKAALRRIQIIHRDPDFKTSLETAVMMVSVFTRSWNAWRKGEEMESINIRSRTGIVPPVRPV